MAIFTSLSESDVQAIVAAYPLGALRAFAGIPAGSVNSNFSLETSENRYFLRVYEEQDDAGARAEAALLTYLAARGVPTPAPLASREGALVYAAKGKPVAVFPWRSGEMRCQASVSPDDALSVGRALGQVHVEGEGAKRGAGRFRPEDLYLRLDRIRVAPQKDLADHADPLRAELLAWSSRRDPALPRGLVHGDLFRDNVLWAPDGRISALLDFESASDGVFAYDLMVTVLAWCFGDDLDVGLARAMTAGYQSVRALTVAEKRALCTEGCLAALRFTITRITDYAMRAGVGPRVMKDYRRFLARFARMKELGEEGVARALGV